MHSISDLTTFCRKTTGDVPSKLVGASTTVVGSKMYLFGGRLVTERRMVSDLYTFDLQTFHWERVPPSPMDDVPRARYFHSADAWNNQLIIFGGMSNKLDSPNPEDLCVLNDVRIYDIPSGHWLPGSASNSILSDLGSESLIPRARYAHLSSVTADRLFIIGGQDFFNVWLDDVHVYDLLAKAWVQKRDYPRHCGTYRSVAVAASNCVRLPQEELHSSQIPSALGPAGQRFKSQKGSSPSATFTPSESLVHLPYSAAPTEEHPSDIFLYSNYNFTDVKRELEVFSPLPDSDFTIQDRSSVMTGSSFPPGLRFPTGAILGTHFIIAGTYLAHTYQSFSIWALDLITMTWSRIDPGSAVSTGSWFRGCLWAEANKFLILGNRNGNLVDDYNRRLLSWEHVAVVDLEAFGIYQPPSLKLDMPMQELGLSALEEGVLTDFEILCDDGRKIKCSRKMLEERWPWFKAQRKLFLQKAQQTLDGLPTSSSYVPLPELPAAAPSGEPRPDPRLTPRMFHLSEPYPITLALVQYFYSLALITPLQHAPAVLSQLLVLSSTYEITHLESLVKHAMHRALSTSTSVGVYEVATLCSCRSLQIRALKTVMSYSQKRPSGRSRQDKESGGGGHRPPDPNSTSGRHNGPNSHDPTPNSRPRGTSDAHWRGQADQQSGGYSTGAGYSRQSVPSSRARLLSLRPDHKLSSPPNLESVSNFGQNLNAVSAHVDDPIMSNFVIHEEDSSASHDRAHNPHNSELALAGPDIDSVTSHDHHQHAYTSAGLSGTHIPVQNQHRSENDTPSLSSSHSRSSIVSLAQFPMTPQSSAVFEPFEATEEQYPEQQTPIRAVYHLSPQFSEISTDIRTNQPGGRAQREVYTAAESESSGPPSPALSSHSEMVSPPITPSADTSRSPFGQRASQGPFVLRLFPGSKRDNGSAQLKNIGSITMESQISIATSTSSNATINEKSFKAMEKKRKRAEAKVRIEALALDLKLREKGRAIAKAAQSTKQRRGKTDPLAMYEGLAF